MIYYTILPENYPEDEYKLLYSRLRPMLPEFRKSKSDSIIPARERLTSALAYFLLLDSLKKEYPERFSFTFSENALNEYVSFVNLPGGKPQLNAPYSDICFNLSHCRTGIACAIAESNVGIDIQDIRKVRPGTARKFAAHLCTDGIVNPDEFAAFWSRYEAYVKLTGDGLRLPSSECDYISDEFLKNNHVHMETRALTFSDTKKTAAYMSAASYFSNISSVSSKPGLFTEPVVYIAFDKLCDSVFL
ncbi:MAG: 4'-phosphopantetheinyl transferase family protein [Lachnospiraceae bacterium]